LRGEEKRPRSPKFGALDMGVVPGLDADDVPTGYPKDGKAVGKNRLEHSVPFRFSSCAGMDIGKDNGNPVSPTYKAKSAFPLTGKIGKVVFDLAPHEARR
jgi:hypothetical protein